MAPRRKAGPAGSPIPGEPVGRWAQVLAEGQNTPGLAIEPFEVTDGLVLKPLTPRRARKLGAAQAAYLAALAAQINVQRFGATGDEVAEIQARIDEALTAYNEALLGEDEYRRVEAYFADQDSWKQELFLNAVKAQFLRLPDDGGCQVCGHVPDALEERVAQLEAALAVIDPEHPALGGELGKEPESSTSSSTTGTSSTPTSPTSSTGSTSRTGRGALARGRSS